jgi:hypothetical protein
MVQQIAKSSHVLLASFAVAGAIALKDYSEAGFIVFLFTTAEWLETRASRKVSPSLSQIFLSSLKSEFHGIFTEKKRAIFAGSLRSFHNPIYQERELILSKSQIGAHNHTNAA